MYIGITCQDVKNRWQNGKTYRESTHFRRAIRKYGWKNIKHEILFTDLPKQRAEDCIKDISGNMKKSNKKIRNATICRNSNITFKSVLEKSIYNTLLQQGFEPQYEPTTFTLWEGFEPITPYYDKETDKQKIKRLSEGIDTRASKILIQKTGKIVGIRYTPDFYFKYNDLNVYIEAKGIENDVFYIKKKMFIKYLDNLYTEKGEKSIYFEVYTKKQLLQAIEIIKSYGQ